MILERAWFKARLIALLAVMLAWTSAHCLALCANELVASGAPGKLPCHQHHHNSRIPASCSYQQLPQADAPQPALVLAPSSDTAVADGTAWSLIMIPSPSTAHASPILDVSWRAALAVPFFVALRI